jgi:uncharacterized RDD family membrane protein YckC
MASQPYTYISSKRRALTTPEGVDLSIEIASFANRIGAFALDMLMLYGSILIITLAGMWLEYGKLGAQPSQFLFATWLVIVFVMRNFWFILFEMGARGATPGKRVAGIRVIARDGGRLEASSVVARNLMREVEVLLPLSALGSIGTGYAMLSSAWALLFMFFPLFNKDRMRAGDLIGGTWVIRAPRVRITTDLHDEAQHIRHYFNFSADQIAVYGAYELQTLEGLLRGRDDKALATVAAVIRAKIGWPEGDDDRAFLNAYYSAVRHALEKNMLFGKKRRDKHDAI